MIVIMGDLHRDISKLASLPSNLGKTDFVIIAGDFGVVYYDDLSDMKLIKELNEKKYKVLWIDGNHENFEALNRYPVEHWNGGKIHKISENVFHLMRGQVFEIDGKTIFTFGGAYSIDKVYRIGCNMGWWEEELPNFAEYEEGLKNLDKHNWNVDYVITHTTSLSLYNRLMKEKKLIKLDYEKALNKYFEEIDNRLNYKHWYFAHYHFDIKMDEKHTLLYNNFVSI